MILKKLHIHNYKLLKEFDVDFTKQISVIIGINGSGKSSILESIALIFSSAYEQTLINKRAVAPENIRNSFVEYLLRYETRTENSYGAIYIPIKLSIDADGHIDIDINVDKEKEKEFYELASKEFNQNDFLPNRLVIYYSGISNHLRNIYVSTEEYLLKQLRQNPETTKEGYVENIRMPMFLFDSSDLALLFAVLWSIRYVERIDKLFGNKLKIQPSAEDLIEIKIAKIEFDKHELRNKIRDIEREIELDHDGYADMPNAREYLIGEYNKERVNNFFGASGRLGTFLKQLRETSLNPDTVFDPETEEYKFKYSYDGWQTFADEILQNPKLLFELLLMLKAIGLLKSIKVNIIKEQVKIESQLLSEGEKQLVIIASLNEVLGISNTLFLFDEPDNFLHPSLQDDLIINIEENNSGDELYSNHYLVTTHNPSFLNNLDSEQGELFIMRTGKSIDHGLSWYGRDTNDTIHDIMGSEFRPDWARKEIQAVDALLDAKKITEAESAFNNIKRKLSGEDSEIIRLQAKLDFLKD